MALPDGLTTFTLRFGEPNGYTDSTGALALVGETGYLFPVDPSTDKPVNVTDVVSGQAIIPKRVTVTIGDDGKASVGPLPHTGQTSLSPAGFAYRVEWNIPSNKPSPRNRTFVVPSGATAYYDLLVPAATVPAVAISQPTVASVNGKTGAVALTASDVGAATPADLTAGLAGKQNTATLAADTASHVSDGSALDDALRAAFDALGAAGSVITRDPLVSTALMTVPAGDDSTRRLVRPRELRPRQFRAHNIGANPAIFSYNATNDFYNFGKDGYLSTTVAAGEEFIANWTTLTLFVYSPLGTTLALETKVATDL